MQVSRKVVGLVFGGVLTLAATIGGYCSLPTYANDCAVVSTDTPAQVEARPVQQDADSRAWYILSQTDTDGLLLGLPERLGKAVDASRRQGAMWKGVENGGRLSVDVQVEGDAKGEILIGFFADPRWWRAAPAQIRSVPGPGRYTFERLIPGKYELGAMQGTLPRPTALGVHAAWPAPVEIVAGGAADIRILVSTKFQNRPAGAPGLEEGFAGQWAKMDPAKTITVRTVDSAGKPLPFCRVTFVDRGNGAETLAFHDAGTDEQGYAYCDKIGRHFSLCVQRFDVLPGQMASRYEHRKLAKVYNVQDRPTITIKWDQFPAGTARAVGRVHDQYDRPLKQYYLTLTRYIGEQHDWSDATSYALSVPVVDPEGRYEVAGLPPGTYTAMVRHFDCAAYAWSFDGSKVTIHDEPNAVVRFDVQVEAKNPPGESSAESKTSSKQKRLRAAAHASWEGKTVAAVDFVGNSTSSKERLLKLIQTQPGQESSLSRADEDVDKLTTYYRGLGFFRVQIGRDIGIGDSTKRGAAKPQKPRAVTVVFHVDEGPRYRIREVRVAGNKRFANEELLRLLTLKGGDYFDQNKHAADTKSLLKKYTSFDFIHVQVKPDVLFLERGSTFDLIYNIEEGAAESATSSGGSRQKSTDDGPAETMNNTGRVIDKQTGKPIAGASVYVRERPTGWRSSDWHPADTRNLGNAITDAEGRFVVTASRVVPPGSLRKDVFPVDVIAVAKGFSVAWKHLASQSPATLELVPEGALRGTVVDGEGHPVAKVKVRAVRFTQLDQLACPDTAICDYPDTRSSGFLDIACSDVPLAVETDDHGRFVLGGLPREVRVLLRIDDPRFVPHEVFAATTSTPQPKLEYFHDEPVYTNDFRVALTPGVRLRLHVVAEDTGEPVLRAGVAVQDIVLPPRSFTDKEGQFIQGQLKAGKCGFEVVAPDGSDYLGVVETIIFDGRQSEIDRVVKLPRGVVVTGRVVDELTAEGLGGAEIACLRSAEAMKQESRVWPGTTKSKPDGSFRLAVPAGKSDLVVFGSVPGHRTRQISGSLHTTDARFRRTIEAVPGKTVSDVKFTLSPVAVYAGTVVDPEGRPVPGTLISTTERIGERATQSRHWTADERGRFKLDTLYTESGLEKSKCEIVFRHPQRGLAAAQTVSPPQNKQGTIPLDVKLQPVATASGRVVGPDQEPIAGVTVRAVRQSGANNEYDGFEDARAVSTTDAQGRFTLRNLVPDVRYSVVTEREGPDGRGRYVAGSASNSEFQTKPGQEHELPDISAAIGALENVPETRKSPERADKGAERPPKKKS